MPYDKIHKLNTRNKIIAVATEIFSRHGFESSAIGQIMEQAKLTHGAFYAHFASKEALYAECFTGVLVQSSRSRLVKKPLSLNRLLSLTIDYFGLHQHSSEQPGPEAILFNEASTDNEKIKTLFQQSYKNVKTMLEKRLSALARMQKVTVSPETIKFRSRAMMTSLVGAVTLAKILSDHAEKESILLAAQSHILTLLKFEPTLQQYPQTGEVNR